MISEIIGMLNLHITLRQNAGCGLSDITVKEFRQTKPRILYKRMLSEIIKIGEGRGVLFLKRNFDNDVYETLKRVVRANHKLSFIKFQE